MDEGAWAVKKPPRKLLHLRIRGRLPVVGLWKDPTQTRANHPWKNSNQKTCAERGVYGWTISLRLRCIRGTSWRPLRRIRRWVGIKGLYLKRRAWWWLKMSRNMSPNWS
jgi:hypothetical protein